MEGLPLPKVYAHCREAEGDGCAGCDHVSCDNDNDDDNYENYDDDDRTDDDDDDDNHDDDNHADDDDAGGTTPTASPRGDGGAPARCRTA